MESTEPPNRPVPSGVVARLRDAWERSERLRGPVFLLLGGLWDLATLRIDRVVDNLLLCVYLLLFAGVVVLKLRVQLRTPIPVWLTRRMHWVDYLGQFLLGGLLSAYFVYYLHGAPVLRAAGWLVLLVIFAAVNELSPVWLKLPELWAGILAAVTFHFALSGGPVLLGFFIGPVFPLLLAGFLATAVHLCAVLPWPPTHDMRRFVGGSSMVVLAVLSAELLAFSMDFVPPLPLTLMSAEIVPEHHDSYKHGVASQLLAKAGFAPTLTWTPGLRVEAKTPVFLPAAMDATILHIWEHYNGHGWAESDAIPLKIKGGRRDGFRTYSRKRHLAPGDWRVRVTTEDRRELGRVYFALSAESQRIDSP